jgi:hypothetical protein
MLASRVFISLSGDFCTIVLDLQNIGNLFFSSEQAMKAQSGSRSIVLLFL